MSYVAAWRGGWGRRGKWLDTVATECMCCLDPLDNVKSRPSTPFLKRAIRGNTVGFEQAFDSPDMSQKIRHDATDSTSLP